MTRRVRLRLISITLLLGVAGIWLMLRFAGINIASPEPSLLPTQQLGNPPAMRLKDGLNPPTNKWFSSLVFSKELLPVYPKPLSFKPSLSGFEIGLPKLSVTDNSVTAAHQKGLGIEADVESYRVEAYDDLSATVAFQKGGTTVLLARLVRGSPYVFVQAEQDTTLVLEDAVSSTDERVLSVKRGNQVFGAVAEDNLMGQAPELTLRDGDTVTFYAASEPSQEQLLREHAPSKVLSTAVTTQRSDGNITTLYNYETENGQPTLAGFDDLRLSNDNEATTLVYPTLHGELKMNKGRTFSFSMPNVLLEEEKLDIPANLRTKLETQLNLDIENTQFIGEDAYFAGKELSRAARLLAIARQLGFDDQAEVIAGTLETQLDRWLVASSDTPAMFVYDDRLNGVVATEPSFGSEDFNDHHFHYGYFLYAASILGEYRPELIERYQPVLDLLAADIASYEETDAFPRLRVFDPYAGHSWASGYGNFADGNNQESSSEAVQAWYGLYLWSRLTGNQLQQETAEWLYGNERLSAMNKWLRPPQTYLTQEGFNHQLVSIVWSAKLDYATFFSPRPQAKLGIQLLPFNEAHSYLGELTDSYIEALLAEAAPDDNNYNGQFGDYLIMLLSNVDRQKALKLADELDDKYIDSANSRTAMEYYIMSR